MISQALAENFDVDRFAPRSLASTRLGRLAEMIWWDNIEAPRRAARSGAEAIIHCTNVGLPTPTMKSIVVVHDVMALDHPNLFDKNYVRYLRVVMPQTIHRAALLVTPSEHSKRRIMSYWPTANVQVVPWVDPRRSAPQKCSYPGGEFKVLVVSSIDMHKRVDLAVSAVGLARSLTGIDFQLTVVGRPGNAEEEFRKCLKLHDSDSRWTRRLIGIGDDELSDLYAASHCLLVPSIDEGFCLPVLEAGRHALPVVHTGRGSLNEVAGTAFSADQNPDDDILVISKSLVSLADEPIWRHASEASRAAVTRFKWSEFVEAWSQTVKEAVV